MRRLFLLASSVLLVWSVLFFGRSFPISGFIEEVRLWWTIESLNQSESEHHGDAEDHEAGDHHAHRGFFVRAAFAQGLEETTCRNAPNTPFAAFADTGANRYFGHVPTELEWAPLSLKKSCGTLSVLVPDWITIETAPEIAEHGLRVTPADPSVREAIETYRRTTDTPPLLMPTVLLETGYDVDHFLAQLSKPTTTDKITGDLLATAEAFDAAGLCLDFKQLDAKQLQTLAPVFNSVSARLHEAGRQSCIVLSARQSIWENRALMQAFDTVILKAFREPWIGSPPGPLAAEAWFEDLAERALAAIGPDRLTIAIGSFAAEWTTRQPLPETLPVVEAWKRIGGAGAELSFSPEIGNSFSSYRDKSRSSHKVWLLDAASAHNAILTLEGLGIRNIALWSLGREDPGIWKVLANETRDPTALRSDLSDLRFSNYVSYRGEGPFLRVVSRPRSGFREVDVDPVTGRITAATYRQMPRPYELERYGQAPASKLVLTFDDGPDPVYTTAILDTLKTTQTPGAFFVVGSRVMEEPGLLNRMIAEGHEVGSHTFSHPRMDQISHSRTELEHGMMAKLIAGYSGHKTLLYREPFLRAGGPIEESRVRSLEWVQSEGGIISGMDIVPKDWTGMSSEAIVDYVVGEVNNGGGNVILLHDGGEDRTATVEALPLIIRDLRAQGYEFTTLSDLLGTTRADLMPEVSGRWLVFDRLSFEFLSVTWFSLETVFWTVLGIGVIRMLIILVLAHRRQRVPPIDPGFEPKVTVVIPAFNEEHAIRRCITSVLASDYSNFDIVVIDDGSQDETFDEVLRFRNNPRVHIYAQLNQGKWAALNAAVANTSSEILVCIDADTEIEPQAIGHLVRQFANPRVGAVAGKITVANRRNLLTRLQALEYVTAQNFDRRAFDLVNGILVVPGAVGAWRTAAVREAGRYRNDTLTEDADLTIAVNRAGYRVTYEDRAVAFTRAPETVRQLLGQRLRWSLGMFQCAWKHKSAFFERRAVGLMSIPDMLIFGYLFPLLAPIADAFVLLLLYKTFAGTWSGDIGTAVSDTPTYLIWAYMILPLLDLFVAAYALKTDKRESMHLLWLFPFQRFFYRQLLYFSVYRSVLRAVTGRLAGWGRVSRRERFQLWRRAA
ncbi:glycosyltransferase [Marimonas arenosa]|uniref:Chitooligosaccharide deacetylase n=1 Tax=Marimonas arenosa TaxID=1795305 RepID=A0AAE3WG42_9RHOB|nr:glycosyltransferase [Marimonas arenosa]